MSTEQLSVPTHTGPHGRPALYLDLACQGSVTVILVGGELDMGTVHLFDDLVGHVVQAGPARVVLDLSKVRFFCADGLNALLHAHHTVAAAGDQLVLRAPSAVVQRVLAITRTENLFHIDTDPGGTPGADFPCDPTDAAQQLAAARSGPGTPAHGPLVG
jgi:anti-anti-sigma factor